MLNPIVRRVLGRLRRQRQPMPSDMLDSMLALMLNAEAAAREMRLLARNTESLMRALQGHDQPEPDDDQPA